MKITNINLSFVNKLILALTIFSLSSCQLYLQTNKDDIQNISVKTEMQPFNTLEEPFVFTIPVQKTMHFLGNKETGYPILETTGNAIVVYDWKTDSVFDWAFFEERNAKNTPSVLQKKDFDGKFPISQLYSDLYNNKLDYLYKSLNSFTGKIENSDYGKSSYSFTKNHYVSVSTSQAIDDQNPIPQTAQINIYNPDMSIHKTFSIQNFVQFYNSEKHFFILTSEPANDTNIWNLFILNDDGNNFLQLGSFSNLKDTSYEFHSATEDTVFIYQRDKIDENLAGTPITGITCILAYKIDGSSMITLTIPDDPYIFDNFITYNNEIYILDIHYDFNNLNHEILLYHVKQNGNSTEYEIKTKISADNIHTYLEYVKRQNEKVYFIFTSLKEDLSINYINLETFTFNHCTEISPASLLQN